MVHIAVFAAFWPRVGGVLLANAASKPVCAIRPLDVLRYGRQKRQETARNGKEVATDGAVGGKDGTDVRIGGYVQAVRLAPACRCRWRVWHDMRLFKVLAAPDGIAVIELIYQMQ
jgi:hypothetical protein